MNIKIDGLIFDGADYDADGDVLYLARGSTSVASEAHPYAGGTASAMPPMAMRARRLPSWLSELTSWLACQTQGPAHVVWWSRAG
jgi:hypothetical protein